MKGFLIVFFFNALFCCVLCESGENRDLSDVDVPFSQDVEGEFVVDRDHVYWDSRDGPIDHFVSVYGSKLNEASSVEFHGLTNKMAEVLVSGVSNVFQENPCSISSLTFKGIRDEECPSMQREERKRPCKMNRETVLRMLVNTFLSCPLQSLSIEANHFSASAVIELTQNVSKGAFPTLSLLDIDDNNYNYDNVAMPRLMRIIQSIPRNIEVRSFYVETLNVIKHNHGEDTPFRYNFDDRYPKDCKFYSEPIKDEEFELLIKYQPCLYAESLLAHGTGRGLAWVNYMTTLFSEGKFINLKTMEIFGNDLFKGDVDTFLKLFTPEHLPVLQSLDMSSNGLKSIHITENMMPTLELLMLDTNDLSSLIIDDNSLPNLTALKLGYNKLTEFHFGKNSLTHLRKLYLDNNKLHADIAQIIIDAPFVKSLTFLSLFNNPGIGENAEEFVSTLVKGITEHRFERLEMLYLGQCGLKERCREIEQVAKANIPTLRHVNCF